MRSLTTNGLATTAGDDLHDLTCEINPGPSVSVPQMYYPPFSEKDLSVPMMNYQYPMSEGPIDLTYMLATASANGALHQNLLMDETSQAGPGGLRNGHAPVMSSASVPLLPHQAHVQSPAQSSQTISFRTAVTSGRTHTMLPPAVHPDRNEPAPKHRADSRALNKVNSDACAQADPHVAAFIREKLGDNKWIIFSARLFERRLGVTKTSSKHKTRELSDAYSKNGGGASAIDFMVKVEVVKEVLRTYVPHPYNPLKSLKHGYAASPTGEVTLTRSTVLALSGWSNTQFSYWARRVEAVSVLTPHDERLRTLGIVLQQRLRGDIGAKSTSAHSDRSEGEGSERSGSSNSTSASASGSSSCFQPEFDHVQSLTGKGLDIVIDEVKKRTGASQFLRGKHSSLDPFGAIYIEGENGIELSAPMFMPTFQAVEYACSSPPCNAEQQEKEKRRDKIQTDTHAELEFQVGSRHEPQAAFDSRRPAVASPHALAFQEPIPATSITAPMNPSAISRSRHAVAITSAQQNTQTRGRHQQHISKEAEHPSSRRELFPVSDSRSELENMSQTHKRSGKVIESFPKKRTKQSDLAQ